MAEKTKKKFKDTKVANFIKTELPDIAGDILKVTGDITGVEVLENIGNMINERQDIKQETKNKIIQISTEELKEERELEIEDRANARAMQIAALGQEDKFSKRFIYYLASFWSVSGIVYIYMATFTSIINDKIADTVLGFLLGTIVATIINFFFGSSRGSGEKQNLLNSFINNIKTK